MLMGILCKHLVGILSFFQRTEYIVLRNGVSDGDKQSSNKSHRLNFVLPDKHILKYLHVNTVNYTDTQCSGVVCPHLCFVVPSQMSSSWIHLPDRILVFHLEETVL